MAQRRYHPGGGGYSLSAAKTDKRFRSIATLSMFNSGRVRRNGFADSQLDTLQARLRQASDARAQEMTGGKILYAGDADMTDATSEPPTFVAVGDADGIAPPAVMERRVAALRRAGTDVEYHRYRGVGHGFGLGLGTTAEGWVADAVRFWARHIKREPDRSR